REHPLFGARKESIGQIPSGGGRHRYTHIGVYHTHFGFVCLSGILRVVPGAGIEPARLAAGDFESPASTNFTTRAGVCIAECNTRQEVGNYTRAQPRATRRRIQSNSTVGNSAGRLNS